MVESHSPIAMIVDTQQGRFGGQDDGQDWLFRMRISGPHRPGSLGSACIHPWEGCQPCLERPDSHLHYHCESENISSSCTHVSNAWYKRVLGILPILRNLQRDWEQTGSIGTRIGIGIGTETGTTQPLHSMLAIPWMIALQSQCSYQW